MQTQPDLPSNVTRSLLPVSQLEKACYRLSVSLKAGIPIAQAWENESQLLRGRTRRSFDKVLERIQAGMTLADAIAKETCFPPMLTEMVRVGEETGQLDQAFLRTADHYRNLVRMKRTFLQGITWPVLQLIAAVAVMSLFFVVLHLLESKISGLFAPDLFMLGLSPLGNLLLFWGVLLFVLVSVFLAVKGIRSGWFGSLPMRIAMAVPMLGSTINTLALSRFAWSFGMAVDAGMNAQRAIRLGLRSTQNSFYRAREAAIATSVAEGNDFFTALHRADAFPNDLLQAVQVGELTGELTESLERLSDDYREQSAINLRRISQISGFGIFIMVGSMIGFSILLMYASYLGTLADAMKSNTLTLEQIRKGQQTSNPVISARNELVKDFVENNEDFKQIESIYTYLGRYNEMTPDEFLDGLFPDSKKSNARSRKKRREQRSDESAVGAGSQER